MSRDRLPIRYLDNTILVSDKATWTWVRIPQAPYEFQSPTQRESSAARLASALVALAPRNEPVEAHLIVTHHPFNTQQWARDLSARSALWSPKPGWLNYLSNMADYVQQSDYLTKSVYLGIKLPGTKNEGKFNMAALLGPAQNFFRTPEKLLGIDDPEIPVDELRQSHAQANIFRRVLADSHVGAIPVNADEVAWLISKPLYPTLMPPDPSLLPRDTYRGGELHGLVEATVEAQRRFLKISQFDHENHREVDGYSAWVCASRFPEVLHYPEQEPWMHHSSTLPFPVDIHARFTIVPAAQVAKDVKKRLADAMDQASHISEGGMHVPLEVLEQLETATVVGHDLKKNTTPWVYARYRFNITADSADEVIARTRTFTDHYRDLSIDMVCPSGDQFQLLKEAIPGFPAANNAPYYQKQDCVTLAAGMPHATSQVGDNPSTGEGWLGPYLGETTSRVRLPVFLSPHAAMARNYPPTIAVIGAPGGGKSMSAFTLAYQCATQGVWTIYIDPKADAKPMGSLPGLGNAQVLDLRAGADGMLDPFSMADSAAERSLLALETLRLLLGGVRISEEREAALIRAVDYVATQQAPSLSMVVDVLVQSTDLAAQNLGATLRTLQQLPFARLCFAPDSGIRLRPEEGLTIVTLLGLDLPAAGSSPENYSYENRLAVSVLYLLTRYARRLMLNLNKSHPKAIFVDEAWAITNTDAGARLIPEIARMGRSHNTALVMVTQNAQDLMDEQITNSVSSVLAFRSTNTGEIDAVLSLLGLEVTEGNRAAVRDLYTGECLMRDVDRRVSRVQVVAWEPNLYRAFNTNPETRGKNGGAGEGDSPAGMAGGGVPQVPQGGASGVGGSLPVAPPTGGGM